MKVGILTFHNAINYGAILQAYALQHVVSDMGCDCKIINYRSPAVDKQYRWKKLNEHPYWKTYIMQIFSKHRLDKKKNAFAEFQNNNMKISEPIKCVSPESISCYDAVIVGSDQVFNPKNTEGDKTYLLDFDSNARKIAYAASIGNSEFLELWSKKYGVDYLKLLRDFDFLSFREESSATYVSSLLGRTFPSVADPVILAGTDFWLNRINIASKNEDYIFVYNLGNLDNLFEIVKNVAAHTKLKVFVANKDIKGDIILHRYNDASSLSPLEFVEYIANASYVITDSFHASAFSVILHKNFYSVANDSRVNTNSRLSSLLSSVGLSDRMVTKKNEFEIKPNYDFEMVDNFINESREFSVNWLKKALGISVK